MGAPRVAVLLLLAATTLATVKTAAASTTAPNAPAAQAPQRSGTPANPATTLVHVVDERSAPVAGAQIVSAAPDARVLATTDANGDATIALGSGPIFARSGRTASAVAVLPSMPSLDRRPETVRLVIHAQVIGTTIARDRPDFARIATGGPAVLALGGAVAALGLVPNYRTAAEGGSGRQALNGMPLALPAQAAGGRVPVGIPTDLIDSVDPVQADDGSITPNFHLLNPTPSLAGGLRFRRASFDGAQLKSVIADTRGRFGYALALVDGTDDGVLAGRTFRDSSGITYDHSTGARHADASLVANYALGSTTISVVGLGTKDRGADIATTQPGSIPFGYGPGAVATSDFGVAYALVTQVRGRDLLHAVDVRIDGGAQQRDPIFAGGTIDGATTGGYRFHGSYDEIGWTRSFGADSLGAKVVATRNSADGFTDADVRGQQSSEQSLALEFERKAATNVGGSVRAIVRQGTFSGLTPEVTAHVGRSVAGADVTLTALASQAQTLQASYAGAYVLAAPQSADIVCGAADGTATLRAPSQLGPTRPTALTLRATIRKTLGRRFAWTAGGFAAATRNALVDVTTAPASPLASAYVAQVQNAYANACPGEALGGDRIALLRDMTVPLLQSREAYADVKFPVGALDVETTYETLSEFAPQVPAELRGLRSDLVPFGQIAGVPLQRANAIVSYRGPRLLAALAAQFVSANNAAALPAHVSVSAGVQIELVGGRLTVSAQNIAGGPAGTLSSRAGAIALAASGVPFPILATPLRRTWNLSYALGLGKRPLQLIP
jgi:hypothetical protein